ncbi:MAG: hypothetical protein GY841_09740 [FCB group bacterium]|nr:hypothetical protein [FCB group bacterium]
MFGKKDKPRQSYEDPATRCGRMINARKKGRKPQRQKPSFLARLFRLGHDSDFVYYGD